jgi:hypothetical protein
VPGVRADRPGQQGVVALAGPTAVGRDMALGTEEATLGASTVRALQTLRVEMPFEPTRADAVIPEVAKRKVSHVAMRSQPAR